jgi:hypothetical protein
MVRGLPRFAALAAAAAASAALIGGTAHADDVVNQGGKPGKGGSATVYCRIWAPSEDDASRRRVQQCIAVPGRPGAPGKAIQN